MGIEPKLSHKLLVSFELSPEKPVSGSTFMVTLILKNIGDSAFPGGQLTQFSVRFASNTVNTLPSGLAKIPAIGVGEVFKLVPNTFEAIEDGLAWMQVSIKSVDDGEMHLFQNPNFDMGASWGNAVQVRKKEYLEIIDLLHQIVELLKEERKEND